MDSHGGDQQLSHAWRLLTLRRTFGPRNPRHLHPAHSAGSDEGAT